MEYNKKEALLKKLEEITPSDFEPELDFLSCELIIQCLETEVVHHLLIDIIPK